MVFAILNLHVTPMPPTKFWLNLPYHWEQMRFEDFHLRYRTRMILAILNLYVAPMPSIKSGLNPHYSFGGMSFEEIQNGRSGTHLGCLNGTNLAVLNLHVSPMPPTKFQLNPTQFKSRCCFKIFKLATMATILDIGTEISNS